MEFLETFEKKYKPMAAELGMSEADVHKQTHDYYVVYGDSWESFADQWVEIVKAGRTEAQKIETKRQILRELQIRLQAKNHADAEKMLDKEIAELEKILEGKEN